MAADFYEHVWEYELLVRGRGSGWIWAAILPGANRSLSGRVWGEKGQMGRIAEERSPVVGNGVRPGQGLFPSDVFNGVSTVGFGN